MKYYLKKCWPTVTAASICMVVAYGLQVCTSLVQIQITQGLLDGDLRAFTIRIILLLLTWLAVVLCLIAETFFQGRAVRRMNNALRRDMAAGLLHKTHQEYHKQESGEYLSQFTNDVNQIEQMAWTPFFTIMGSAAQVVFGHRCTGIHSLADSGDFSGHRIGYDLRSSSVQQTVGNRWHSLCRQPG